MSTPEDVVRRLGLDAASVSAIRPYWEAAESARPAGLLPFCLEAVLPQLRSDLELPAECDVPLRAMASTIASDASLSSLAWYAHWRTFMGPDPGGLVPIALESRLGDDTGVFWLLLCLGFAPALVPLHRRRGYPAEVTVQTISQVRDYLANHLAGTGRLGCYARQFRWLGMYLRHPYVRLGRLAYELRPFASQVEVWRHRRTRLLLALANQGTPVDGHGGIVRQGSSPAWVATLERCGDAVQGHPIDPAGAILRRRVRLGLDDWEPFLGNGDPVIAFHIPPGGGMTLPLVRDSFLQAVDFFRRFHPESAVKAIWCATWFLDPQLNRLLPEEANPLRLQRCLYLHPVEPWEGGLWYVFQSDTSDPSTLRRDTSLRRILADHLGAGGRWSGGAGFIACDDALELEEGAPRRSFAAAMALLDAGG